MRKLVGIFILSLILGIYSFSNISAQTKGDCLLCHEDESLTALETSAHAKLSCVVCHKGVKPEPHETMPGKVNCGLCHRVALKSFQNGVHGKALAQKLKNAPDCQNCHGTHDIKKIKNETSRVTRLNLHTICGKCHPDATNGYAQSIHGELLIEGGMEELLTCSDCHHSHETKSPLDAKSLAFRTKIPQLCSNCHPDAYQEYMKDVHGMALERGILRSATCIDCHGEHSILPAANEKSTINPANISKVTCAKCHLKERVSKQFGIVRKEVMPYHDPYHGIEVMAGDKRMPHCADCHGAHNIRPPSDAKSMISKENLPGVCGKCHTGAGINFAKGKFHFSDEEKGVSLIRGIYTILIILVIGGMVLHNLLDIIRYAIDKYRESVKGKVLRFTLNERIQHIILFTTFTLLAYTGLVLRFPDLFLFSWVTKSATLMGIRAMTHRIAGSIFVIICLYNFFYMLFTARGRQQLRAIFPTPQDLLQAIQNIFHKLRLLKSRPKFGHYDYGEKAEYWALVWGGFVMIATGFVLWFPDLFLGFMPKWLLDVCKAIHFYEALLATLAIVVWHFYFVFLSPESYPVNWGMLTGKISKHELKEKHSAEYEKLKQEGKIEEDWD